MAQTRVVFVTEFSFCSVHKGVSVRDVSRGCRHPACGGVLRLVLLRSLGWCPRSV